jgi:AcrR family transcriptional regulator
MVTRHRLARSAPDERREHILEVARGVFVAHGFAAASMSDIAARVGGSKATLYKYFCSKEALFEAVMQRKCAEVRASFDDPDLSAAELRTLLRTVGRRLLTVIYQPEALALYRVIHAEGARFPTIARAFFAEGPEKMHHALAGRLAALAARGAIRCDNPLLAAQQFIAMLKGERHMRVSCGVAPPPDMEEIAAAVDHAVALVAGGLERAAPQPA